MPREKTRAVLDTNIVVSGIFWKGDARKCFTALAQRKFTLCASPQIFEEYREAVFALKQEKSFPENPEPVLRWLELHAKTVEPMPLGKMSRDRDDNIFIGCALAAGAKFVVTRDKDLLVLKKPFGIEIVQPREFLRKQCQS